MRKKEMALKHTRSIKDQTHQQNLESTITDHCRMENLQRSSPLTPLTNTWSTAPEGRSGLTVVRGVAHLSIIWLVVCTSMIPANINTSPPRRPEEDGRNASKYKHVCYRRNMLVIICIHDVFPWLWKTGVNTSWFNNTTSRKSFPPSTPPIGQSKASYKLG